MNTFKDVIGHEEIVNHLQNAMKTNKVSHAYIFQGEDGIGKNFVANIFAAALLCNEHGINPCTKCKSCLQAVSANQPDIRKITHEKASIGVDDIRLQLNNDIAIKPYVGPYKIYIIDEAEKMTEQAQNALLKTIEEPPGYAIILLLTNNSNSFLPTILSRCVLLNFKAVDKNRIKQYLVDEEHIVDYQAQISASFSGGNLGKAIKYATSERFVKMKEDIIHLMNNMEGMDLGDIAEAVKYFSENKGDILDCLDLMLLWYRDILMFKATQDGNLLVYKEEVSTIKKQAKLSSFEGLEHIIQAFSTVKDRLNANVNFEVAMELLLLSMKESYQ
ncbi:DNA polymerase III subunit delta' [Lachnoclostridium sp.]|uniref:DNA polymerase III subunit delta' n=1 Tax=Lachnoclostridium sp. TaxID=2028282 RepID=UPI00289CEC0F|nr:DNA polymerase III subunit delta' [Lachnoclostridium sp.]